MVRLLPEVKGSDSKGLQQFQSHNGAIAARCQQRHDCEVQGFNPTMVRLLPLIWRPRQFTNKCFNPTMVRLLPV